MRRSLVLLGMLVSSAAAAADSGEHLRRLETRAAAALDEFRAVLPALYFNDAYAYAVLPLVIRFGVGLGGAFGRGVLYEHGRPTGRVRYWQTTSGVQAGARAVSLIVLFRDAAALEEARAHGVRFMGQAGIAVATVGALKTPGYSSGVAVFARDRFGFMMEATIAATGLVFRPQPTRTAQSHRILSE